ncbi:MAG TPA: PHB depolymerase family esterase [Kofleriaceae bacterium]|nr:PHB depolymerase family esterase [Kofleriaceae bacterium]
MRRAIASALLVLALLAPATAAAQMVQVSSFGSNPGALDMYKYVPDGMPDDAPLVVLLHGCSQQASGMTPTGFLELADEYHFYVVLPQQRSANNPVNCFNWAGEYGDPANLVRGQGENQSMKQMIDKMKADHSIDPARIYIAGFSSGGAFAAVMMATWPELFDAGAVMSGVPYRCATTVQGAYDCMALGSHPELKKTPAQWGDLVRNASNHDGAYPRVILFHGTSDTTVHPDNMIELIEQWTDVHGIDAEAAETQMVAGHERRRFGQGEVEAWRIGGMVHAVAIGDDPDHACGTAGSFVSDKGLCEAYRAIRFFGLTGEEEEPPPGGGGGGGGDGGGDGSGAPTISIVSPSDGSEVGGTVKIEVEASDDGGVARVEFLVDGMLRGADASAPYSNMWQSANAGPGEHTITAVAYDAFDNSAEATVTVTLGEGDLAAGDGTVDPISWGCAAGGRGTGAAGWPLVLLALAFFHARRRRAE